MENKIEHGNKYFFGEFSSETESSPFRTCGMVSSGMVKMTSRKQESELSIMSGNRQLGYHDKWERVGSREHSA